MNPPLNSLHTTYPAPLANADSILVLIVHIAIAPAVVRFLTTMAANGEGQPQAQLTALQDSTLNTVCLVSTANATSPAAWPSSALQLNNSMFWVLQVRGFVRTTGADGIQCCFGC